MEAMGGIDDAVAENLEKEEVARLMMDSSKMSATPTYLTQMDFGRLMEARKATLVEIQELKMKLQAARDELYDIDFFIDYNLDSDLVPMGLQLLSPDFRKERGFGSELDVRTIFKDVATRERCVAKGKTLIEEKVNALIIKQKVIKGNAMKSQNFRIIAVVNELLKKALASFKRVVNISASNPEPFPPLCLLFLMVSNLRYLLAQRLS